MKPITATIATGVPLAVMVTPHIPPQALPALACTALIIPLGIMAYATTCYLYGAYLGFVLALKDHQQ